MKFKIEISQFYDYSEPKQNQTFFHRTYLNMTSFFIGHNILKSFNDFYNWHLSVSLQKRPQASKVK